MREVGTISELEIEGVVVSFRFDIEPVEQARPRATRFGKGIRLYDPAKVQRFKKELGTLARERVKGDDRFPLGGPLRVTINFYRPVQKSLSKKERSRRLSGAHRPTVKPDVDNYVKSTLDALNGLLWADDAHIFELQAGKFYSDHPRLVVTINEVKEKDD